MPEDHGQSVVGLARPRQRRRRRRRRPAVRRIAVALLISVALLIVWVIVLGITGAIAATSMSSAQAQLEQVEQAVQSQNTAQASELTARAGESTAKAASMVNNPAWWIAARVPFFGGTAEAVTRSIGATDIATREGLGPLITATAEIDQKQLRTPDGAVNIALVTSLQVPADKAAAAVSTATTAMAGVPVSGVLAPVADKVQQLSTRLIALKSQVDALDTAVNVTPALLGSQSEQRYFVAFTSPAESRGSGGFLGAYGILVAKAGTLRFEKLGPNTDLADLPAPAIDLGPDYNAIYGGDTVQWTGMNQSAHFPYAARQWIAAWKQQTGQDLQGAMSIDPATLSYLSGVTGPIALPNGKTLQPAEVVPYLANGIYLDFGIDNAGRKSFQVEVAKQAMSGVLTGAAPAKPTLSAMARAAGERRLLLYSADPAIESRLERYPLSGVVDTAPGPYAGLVVDNRAGNKLDYYLRRNLTYTATSCHGGEVDSKITATLTNDAPADGVLPPVVDLRSDRFAADAAKRSTRVAVQILLPMWSGVTSAQVDGKSAAVSPITEAGRPGAQVIVNLDRGKPVVITLNVTEPASARAPRVPEQPLVTPQKTEVKFSGCR